MGERAGRHQQPENETATKPKTKTTTKAGNGRGVDRQDAGRDFVDEDTRGKRLEG